MDSDIIDSNNVNEDIDIANDDEDSSCKDEKDQGIFIPKGGILWEMIRRR